MNRLRKKAIDQKNQSIKESDGWRARDEGRREWERWRAIEKSETYPKVSGKSAKKSIKINCVRV